MGEVVSMFCFRRISYRLLCHCSYMHTPSCPLYELDIKALHA